MSADTIRSSPIGVPRQHTLWVREEGKEPPKKTPEAIECGVRVRALRKYLSQSRKKFAELVGIGESTIGNYEQGLRELGIRESLRIQEKTGCPAAWLMGLVNDIDRRLLMAPSKSKLAVLELLPPSPDLSVPLGRGPHLRRREPAA